MRKTYGSLVLVLVLTSALVTACIPAGGGGNVKKTGEGGLTNSEITSGLKEALIVGTVNAVLKVSKTDGYFGNDLIKIPLPEKIAQFEQPLRMAGFGPQVDSFMLSMNRAAETAAPYAKDLFIKAVKQMTFSDAKRILFGRENEATLYFREKTEGTLTSLFKPVVHKSMAKVGVTKEYQNIYSQLNMLTLGQMQSFDLDSYVTKLALDGLFYMVAQEEKKIRENPVARVSEILQKVFGAI